MKQIYRYIAGDGLEKKLPVDFPTFADGLRELVLCEAIVKSARERRWVGVEAGAASGA